MDILEKLLEIVSKEEDTFYDLAHKEMETGNIPRYMSAQRRAVAFQKVRYIILDMIEKEDGR